MDQYLANSLSKDIGIDVVQIIREWWEMIILRDLFDSPFGNYLVFKGGTALRLAYGSPRFSEDLDFSRIKDFSFESFEKVINDIEKKYEELKIRDCADKFYTFIAQYRVKESWRPMAFSVKIEMSKRIVDEKEKIYNLSMLRSKLSNIEVLGKVIKIDKAYKQKLDAVKTRNAARDVFDIWYLCNTLKIPYKPPKSKLDKKILVRDLRKYLPKKYWKVIDTLGGS